MGSGAPDSMWIREIDTIKAERDKAIADREKISRILHEREEVGQRQIDELPRRLEYEKKDKVLNGFPIRARWVKLSDREPDHDSEVFARKTAEDFLTVIYFAEEGDIKYSVNGESYIFEDQMDQWEWLELRPKDESAEPVVPLPDGRMLGVHDFANLADMFELQAELNEHLDANMIAVADEGNERDIAKWTQNLATAMQQELAELVDCVPWKWWANYQDYDRQNARVEIVDLFHFLISMAQLHGMTAQDVFETYRAKCEINHMRHESGYTEKDPDDCKCI